MAPLTDDQAQVTESAIREISHIATLPEVTMRIIELVEDPTSTAQDLHNVIANDPALCSRILKVVNSSFYGLPGQIGSINRAIVLLGLNAVKNIAISASLAKIFRGGDLCPHFSARGLWQHSIATATAAKLVADEIGLGLPDEAFLAGLMHDIGVMVEMQYDRDRLVEIVDSLDVRDGVPSKDMLERENEVFGANHQHFGHALCKRWKFPGVFANITGWHHDPLSAPADSQTLPAIVYIADRLAATVEGGYRLDLVSTKIDPDVLELLKLRAERVETLSQQLVETFDETTMMLG